jgi:molybdate/tungstate transport system ATP-binding protein
MSAAVAIEALTLTLGAFRLHKLAFTVSRGEILVILGPNGSGKSVTLETIAGFHRPEYGRVVMQNRDVTALPPEQRHVGFVVQNFGLFPHLSVAENVAIARRSERNGAAGANAESQRDTAALLRRFDVAHLAGRSPEDLSPGEKQRVALARALACTPDLFLFDEPFSALDPQTRDQLRDELLGFLRALAIPAIFVTHDHTDAMTLADKIVVLRDGVMMQSGRAAEIFRKPANPFVARFVGFENVLSGRLIETSEGMATIALGDLTLRAPAPLVDHATSKSVYLSIRAEDVMISSPPRNEPPVINRLNGRLNGLRALGPLLAVEIDCGFTLKAYLLGPQASAMNLAIGNPVSVEITAGAIHVMADEVL